MKPFDPATIKNAARDLHSRQVAWRRYLHQHPELSGEEKKTTAFLTTELKKLGLKILPLNMPTGVLAELKGGPGPTVAVRSDIDALPILEESGVSYASVNTGCMHACGHDVHMATVLGAAALLTGLSHIPGTVRFLFQPSEEMPPGGARPMIANGALKDVQMLFGLHVDPNLPTGKISVRDGITMASVFDFNLTITGRGGHAARPHDAVDAIVVASEIVTSLQTVISRETDPIDPVVITFGTMQGGTARNVIAESVRLAGTVRTLSPTAFKRTPKLIKRTVKGICAAHGASFEMEAVADYPILINDPKVNTVLKTNYERLFGRGKCAITDQVLGGEDFACYLEHVPGAMFRLGTMNKKLGSDKSWHASDFKVDENAIPFGTALLAASVLDALNTL